MLKQISAHLFHFDSFREVENFIDKPPYPPNLGKLKSDLYSEDWKGGWYFFAGFCRVCGYKFRTFIPDEADIYNCECGNCGNMGCQPLDDEEEQKEFEI